MARLAAYEDTGLTPEECALYVKCEARQVGKRELTLSKENETLRRAITEFLKRGYSGDMCPHCMNFELCNEMQGLRDECLDGDSEGFELNLITLMK